jgi:small subunit ribosomal protein S1
VEATPVEPLASPPSAAPDPAASPPAAPPPKPIEVVKLSSNLDDLPDDLSPEDFASAVERTVIEFKEGSIIEGTVVRVDPDEVLVDIGFKSEGVIPAHELSIRNNVSPGTVTQVGEVVEAMVLEMEDSEGRMILSKKRAQYERAWGQIEQVMHEGGTVSGPVIEVVKGGLIVDIGLRGFLPASLVELRRVRDLQPYIGENIEAKVIELDRNRNNVVLSRRAYLEEEQAEQRHAFLEDLDEGQIRSGVVSSVVNFGAFVDLGGMDGLVHVSELSWHHVSHPGEVVSVGDEVQVKVLEVDRERERISLSIRQTKEDPWAAFSSGHGVGDIVDGTVTKTVPFGAFVSVTEGVEGLVHVSEIAMHHVESPELELTVGQKVKVRITEVDDDRRRISLSIKQALPEWAERTEERPPPKRREEKEFQKEEIASEGAHFKADASLEAILQELKEKGMGR